MIIGLSLLLSFILGYCFGVKAGSGKPITFKKVKILRKPAVFISNEERENGAKFKELVKQRELEQTLWTGDEKQET